MEVRSEEAFNQSLFTLRPGFSKDNKTWPDFQRLSDEDQDADTRLLRDELLVRLNVE
jgi:hypothetical protein